MVAPYDYLDSMAWNIVISAALIGIALLKLRYDAKKDSIEEDNRNTRIGFAIAFGASGLYQLIMGLAINLQWPFGTPWGAQFEGPNFAGGHFNVLFGGIACLGGLVLIAVALALYFNGGFQVVSYFTAIVGIYGLVDAIIILAKNYTKSPLVSGLGYIGFAAAAIMTVPALHSNNRTVRIVAAIFAFLFAAVWLFNAISYTTSHSGMPLA